MIPNKSLLLIVILLFSFVNAGQKIQNKQKADDIKAVKSIVASNSQKRKEIIDKMNGFISGINGRIKDTGLRISMPVKGESVSSVTGTDHQHSVYGTAKAVFGYALSDDMILYSDPEGKTKTGTAEFRESLQVVLKTEMMSNGKIIDWFFVRRDNGDEGWTDSRFVSKERPETPLKPADIIKKESESGKFMVPATGRRTSGFGYRVHPLTKKSGTFHSGIDIAAESGTPVYAAADGVIASAGYKKNGYGNLIIIEHSDDFATYYGHLSRISVRAGKKVRKGDYIGNIGATGSATGPHLHFEVRRGANALNPDDYI